MRKSDVRFISLKSANAKVEQKPTSRFIIASLNRSFDSYHISNRIINLVGSIFYTSYLDTKYRNLIDFFKNEEKHYIVRITNNGLVNDIKLVEHSKSLIEIQVSILTFIGLRAYLDISESTLRSPTINALKQSFSNGWYNNPGIPKGLVEIFSSKSDTQSSMEDPNMILNRTIFIFENINWSTLVLVFWLGLNVRLNGGTINKRFGLTTVEFTLANTIYGMGYTKKDVFESYKQLKIKDSVESGMVYIYEEPNRAYFMNMCTGYRETQIDDLNKDIEELKQKLQNHNLDINYTKIKSVVDRRSIDDISKYISDYKSSLFEYMKSTIPSFEMKSEEDKVRIKKSCVRVYGHCLSYIKLLTYEIENLKKLSFKDLANDFLGIYTMDGRSEGISSDLKNIISMLERDNAYLKLKRRSGPGRDNTQKRTLYTSSIIRNSNIFTKSERSFSSINNILNSTTSNIATRQLKYNSIFNKKNQISHSLFTMFVFGHRYISINYSDTMVAQNILKILYSENSSEEKQLNLETFLMFEQSKHVLEESKNNSNKSDIRFDLLNSNVNKILFNASENIKKLYFNYIGFIEKDNISLSVKNLTDKLRYESVNRKKSSDIGVRFILKSVGYSFINNLLLGKLLNFIGDNNLRTYHTTSINCELGEEIINRFNYIAYIPYIDKYNSFSLFKNTNKDKIIEGEETFHAFLGSILIGWLLELKLVRTKVETVEYNEKRSFLIITSELSKKVYPKEKNSILHLPRKIPMVIKPKDYGKNGKLGGYLLNDVCYSESLIIENHNLVDNSEITENNILYNKVNYLNSVSFKINQDVLDFVIKNYKEYDLIIDPEYVHNLENKSKLTINEKKELDSFLSKKKLEAQILNLAVIYRNCSEFYLPVRLDYRGRVYCVSEYLNYQGIELAKSLLLFSQGEKVYNNNIISINYLKIFGVNSFGNKMEKKSFNDRIKWVDENSYNILNFKNGILLKKAENKLLFIAFCFEYINYIESINNNEEFFITNLPIQLDATCNGFQHLSLLLEDSNLAKRVNLGPSSWNDIPEDFYSFLALKVKDFFIYELANNINLDINTKESYLRLSKIEFSKHRNIVKKTIMTIPYNATIYTNILYMKEDFKLTKKSNENIYIYNKDNSIVFKDRDFHSICISLNICLYREFPKLEALLNYFKNITVISNKLGLPIPWTLPTGLIVKQKYYGNKTVKFKPFIYSKDFLNLNIIDKNSFNSRKQSRSLMPNLVHSLDAASLGLLVNMYFTEKENINFFSVHDCFAVPCNKVSRIVDLLKLSYYKIYGDETYLKNFDRNFKNFILTQLGDDSFSSENEIIILNINESKIKLKYPNINEILEPNQGIKGFMQSSYTIT